MKRLRVRINRLVKQTVNYFTDANISFFPLRNTFDQYDGKRCFYDFRAGINVALLAFPQGMAYALIAGLPVQYGIYGAAIAALIAPFFCSSRYTAVGPTNATSVLLFSAFLVLQPYLKEAGVEAAEVIPLFLLMVGTFLMLGALFRVASLIQYVSRTVVIGYITAAATLIMVNQLDTAFGYETKGAPSLWPVLYRTFSAIDSVHTPTLILSGITIFSYVILQRVVKFLPNVAITLILMSFVAAAMERHGFEGIKTLDAVEASSWNITLPSVDFTMISKLASGALAVAFLAMLESISIGKALAARTGDRMDVNQEMFGLGLSNVACGFLNGQPASGSLTRSMLNFTSGSTTPLASIITGVLLIGGVFAIGPYIQYVPSAALAVLIIAVGWSLIDFGKIRVAFMSTLSDRITFIVTFGASLLFPLDFAIYFGVATSIGLFLRKAARPELVEYSFNEEGNLAEIADAEERANPSVAIVHVEGSLFFGASELFQDQMRQVSADKNLSVIVLRMKNAHNLDASSVLAIEELIKAAREAEREIIVSGARRNVYKVFRDSGLLEVIGKENFFMGSPANPNASTRNALKRAKELLGDREADIRIYAKPAKEDEG